MEVHFNPEQEAQLSQIASHAGTDTERLVKDAVLRLLEQDARFRAAVREGIAQADRGNLSKRKRWTRVSSGCLTLDAYPLDANRRSGLAKHLRLPERTRAHLAKPTVIEIRKSVRSLKKFPQRGRMGREESTRELLHRRLPHIIAYRMKHDAVEILHIWHPAQDR